jgi:hypothetical protein
MRSGAATSTPLIAREPARIGERDPEQTAAFWPITVRATTAASVHTGL